MYKMYTINTLYSNSYTNVFIYDKTIIYCYNLSY